MTYIGGFKSTGIGNIYYSGLNPWYRMYFSFSKYLVVAFLKAMV